MQVKEFLNNNIDFEEVNPKALKYIKKFITNNISALTDRSYIERLTFGGDRRYDLLKLYDFDENKWDKFKRDNDYITISTENKDLVNSLLLYSYYFHRDKNEDEAESFLIFLMIKLYTSKYHRSFKYGVVEERMEYTLENLSMRFDIRKHGDLLKVFREKLQTMYNNYPDEFENMNDKDVYDNGLLTHFSTRVGHMVNSVAEEYYKNEKVMWSDEEIQDRDEKRATTNMSVEFENLENTTTTKVIKYGLDTTILKDIKGQRYRSDFENMFKNDANKIAQLVSLAINDYIKHGKSISISKAKRYGFLDFYKKSRKRDPKVKELTEELTNEYSTLNQVEFKKVLRRYVGVLIHRELQKM